MTGAPTADQPPAPFVLFPDHPDAADPQVAGSKMGRLAALARAGLTVPAGFVVTVAAWRAQQEAGGPGAPMPGAVAEAVTQAYARLGVDVFELAPVTAVRSSAPAEDGRQASFAGMLATHLGVIGAPGVLDAVRRCWASADEPAALAYRARLDPAMRALPMAVGVLELVPARICGVAFSAHPVTGDRDRMVIEASWGWGEAVVQGLVTPDHVELDAHDGRVLRYDVAAKHVVSALDLARGAVVPQPMPAHLVHAPTVDDAALTAVRDAVLRVQGQLGHPVDVEWVLPRGWCPGAPVVVVQARPITGLPGTVGG